MNHRTMRTCISFALLIILGIGDFAASAQSSSKVLFLGNSYTYFNNLPQLVHDIALSTGDTLLFDSYAPGGYRLGDHFNDVNSQNKIKIGGWDYVVIQGQSQEPITRSSQFINAGAALHKTIKEYNPCAVTMPYMTWGRKNGDINNCFDFPVMCTYAGMDSALKSQYLHLTSVINGEVSPVSVVWNYLRKHQPQIELYDPDESHPSAIGSYAAACCFYTCIFKKDPTLITFHSGVEQSVANSIKQAVKTEVYDKLPQWDFKKSPRSGFRYEKGNGENEIVFSASNSSVQQTYFWDFGDGTTSALLTPTHTYASNGSYTVSLKTTTCDWRGFQSSITDTVVQLCNHSPSIYTDKAWLCLSDTLWTQKADSYQWLENGFPIPENKQYLANYSRYSTTGFSVISSVNGCSELSESFNKTPAWSGYYFDALGNPCQGDTVAFAVLHINGFLSGLEKIFWYKDGLLLPNMNHQDTLLITSAGKYECKIVDPNSDCPLDTTSYAIEYNCGGTGIEQKTPESSFYIYPNPAKENFTLVVNKLQWNEVMEIYNTLGVLKKSVRLSEKNTKISIAHLPAGVYYVRLKRSPQSSQKLIKE